ncbi:MAG: BamA/TamA family outer membrane protein [Planctomycetota bacterium]
MRHIIGTLVVAALLMPVLAAGQEAAAEGTSAQRRVVFPIFGYNAEMGALGGAFVTHFLPQADPTVRGSMIDGYFIATEKNQYELNLYPDLYFGRGTYHLEAHLVPRIWRANYYGIGSNADYEPDPFDSRGLEVTLSLERFFAGGLFCGLEYRYQWQDIDPENGGYLETDAPAGLYGGKVAGAGVSAGYDTRDNTNAARTGWYAKYAGLAYRDFLGTDFEFNTATLDIRKFLPVGDRDALALAGFGRFTTGTVPFLELSTADGVEDLRGIERGRYMDHHILLAQAEYRHSFNRRFGMTWFAEAAQVAPTIDGFADSHVTGSAGMGFRIALAPEHRFNLRIDLASVDHAFGMMIYIREAF